MASQAKISLSDLLDRNKEYSKSHKPFPFYTKELLAGLKRTLIVTCMDPRVIPEKFSNFEANKVPVIRCAGGRVKYAIHDILSLNTIVAIDEIVVIHHVDCGVMQVTDEAFQAEAKKRSESEAAKLDFEGMHIADLHESVKSDVAWLRNSPLIKSDTAVKGAIFDIVSGKLEVVES
ncbi:hypothetical protein M409DRAFT_26629 [Zasmidium cellare ATCC 36951]|uniref:Carbonic anhydrase n=1 Tax=Zasmidium cellare ATCC 36951 TaxID=1080233 RepID=A0A6A6CCL0_ZASCE|nr:uncharacterized protein M409DRAFT_26629 [Zasmidium cellare ATCC 36951]KAF2163186.1 hypothetical protein M409DRAFT_26629 [Zasmidium cellare ATCC 36951]